MLFKDGACVAAKRAPSEAPKLSQIFVEQTQANRIGVVWSGRGRRGCLAGGHSVPELTENCEIYGPPKARVDVEVLT